MGTAEVDQPTDSSLDTLVRVEDFRYENFHVRNIEFATYPLAPFSSALGRHIDGMLGADLLRMGVVTIDFHRGVAHFNDDPAFRGTPISLDRLGDVALVHVRVGSSEFRLLLDSGANMTAISDDALTRAASSNVLLNTVDGLRTSGTVGLSKLSCARKLETGERFVEDLPVRIVSSSTNGFLGNLPIDGLLGSDYLSHFKVQLDLAHDVMYLASDENFKADALQYSSLGFQFTKDADGLFTIVAVWNPSPASEAELTIGDRIKSVGGTSARTITLDQMSARIHQSPGTPIKLSILSHEHQVEKTLQTRSLLCPR